MPRMVALYEKARPASFSEVVGQNKALAVLDRLRAAGGLGGRAFWITGPSGVGKTSIGRLIAAEVADKYMTVEVDASEVDAGFIEEARRIMPQYGWGKGGRAWIINESHGLTPVAIRKLLVLLEEIPAHCVFIFTTTSDGHALFEDVRMDASPLLSRCIELALSRRDLCRPFAERAMAVTELAGLGGAPIEKYVRVLKDNNNNLRAVYQVAESGAFAG